MRKMLRKFLLWVLGPETLVRNISISNTSSYTMPVHQFSELFLYSQKNEISKIEKDLKEHNRILKVTDRRIRAIVKYIDNKIK